MAVTVTITSILRKQNPDFTKESCLVNEVISLIFHMKCFILLNE